MSNIYKTNTIIFILCITIGLGIAPFSVAIMLLAVFFVFIQVIANLIFGIDGLMKKNKLAKYYFISALIIILIVGLIGAPICLGVRY